MHQYFNMKYYLLIFLLINFKIAYTQSTFGPEFTFTNNELLRTKGSHGWNDPLANTLIEMFKEQLVSQHLDLSIELSKFPSFPDELLVKYKDGWWFKVTHDPKVLEVTTKPQNINEVFNNTKRIQTDIFDNFKAIGLTPDIINGGGHIHIGTYNEFRDNSLLFRNFIVDMINHSELFGGIFLFDKKNALTIPDAPLNVQKAIREVVESFDSTTTLRDLADSLNYIFNRYNIGRYSAINLDNIKSTGIYTIELRGIRPQSTAREYLLLVLLFQARIDYLKQFKTPIKYSPPNLNKMSLNQMSQRYADFVTETGLRFDVYKNQIRYDEDFTDVIKKTKPKDKTKPLCKYLLI